MQKTFIFRLIFLYLHAFFFLNASVQNMTLEEKIGQLLIVQFRGDTLNEQARSLVNDFHVSGFIYYKWANALQSSEKIKSLSNSLQALARPSRIPLFICIDQEGGVVNHLDRGCTLFAGNRALSTTKNPILAKENAYVVAKELKALGINVNLAPVVDVNTNPKNPVIGVRSFGSDPNEVTTFAKAMLDGYHMGEIITTLKHFPGHGDVEIDSHEDLPILMKNKTDLQACELIPFSVLAKDADMIMTAHISFPLIDPDHLATFSKPILNILREDLFYNGVIVSDSIGMKGCLSHCGSIENGAIKAINAGCDLLILGGENITYENIVNVHQALVKAVHEKVISVDRIDESVHRIVSLKKKYDLFSNQDLSIDFSKHQTLAKELARKALLIKENKKFDLLQKKSKVIIYAPIQHLEAVKNVYANQEIFAYGENLSKKRFQSLLKEGEASDLILIFLYDIYKNKMETLLVKSLLALKKPVILIALKNPIDTDEFPEADCIIYTYNPSNGSIQATYDILSGL